MSHSVQAYEDLIFTSEGVVGCSVDLGRMIMLLFFHTAVYLCKRTMQNKHRLELADYEAENLARLQKMFSRKWEFIYLQAEAQVK